MLRNRHDNFYFKKIIEKRKEFYDQMFLMEGILTNPMAPKFQVKPSTHLHEAQSAFSNDYYLRTRDDSQLLREMKALEQVRTYRLLHDLGESSDRPHK